jgi:PilZ domain-containing protein
MPEPRPEIRILSDLKLRVWGIGADGRGFSQQAQARNISNSGALLCGLEHDLQVGETIGLQHGEKKVRCQIVWVTNTGSVQRIQAGVKLLSGMVCPWTAELRAATNTGQNIRRWNRHKISVRVELSEKDAKTPMRVNATDISAGGCYVEIGVPLPVGTTLSASLWIASDKLTSPSIVRTSDLGVGMGIEFLGLTSNQQQRFQGYLESLDPWASSIAR